MDKLLLTDEEIRDIIPVEVLELGTLGICRATAKAQRKKIVEFILTEEERAFTYIGEPVHIIQIPESSWQALKGEVNES